MSTQSDISVLINPVLLSSKPRIHLGYLDGLRALAALYVLLSHAVFTVWPQTSSFHGLTLLFAGPFRYGSFAVGLFIVLSGFCLMLPVAKGDDTLKGGALNFFKRRARRILPPYYCAVGVSVFLIWVLVGQKTGTHWDLSLPASPKAALSCLLMLQDVWFGQKRNGVFWSIAVEWRIYFIFPLLVLAYLRFGMVKTTLASLVLSFVIWTALHSIHAPNLHVQYLALFILGAFSAKIIYSRDELWIKWRAKIAWGLIATAGTFLLLCIDYVWRKHLTTDRFFFLDLIVGGVSFSLLIAASLGEGTWLRRFLDWRPLVFIGTFSYSIYLIHAPLVQAVWQYLLRPLHLSPLVTFLLLATIGTTLIVGASYLFFLVCERPFLNTRRKETMADTAP